MSLCRVYVTSGTLRSFDRRPLVSGTGEMLQREETSRAITDGTSMEEQGTSMNPSLAEDADPELNTMDELDALWNSFNWD